MRVVAVVTTTLTIVVAKLLVLSFGALLYVLGLLRVLRRWPVASAAFGVALALATRLPDVVHWAEGALWGRAAQLALYLIGLAMTFSSGVLAFIVPASLPEVRVRVERGLPERWVAPWMAEPLDAVLVRILVVHALVILVPLGAVLAAPARELPYTLPLFVAGMMAVTESHTVFDHVAMHHRPFRTTHQKSAVARLVLRTLYALSVVVGAAAGFIPFWLTVVHLHVHHVENNGPDDVQSTLWYDRASYIDFCRAALRFSLELCLSVGTVRYLLRNRFHRPLGRLVLGYVLFVGGLAALSLLCWPAALAIVAWRWMVGVFTAAVFFYEHGFADPRAPGDNYVNAPNTLTDPLGHALLGEFVHMTHHLTPGRHWSKLQPAALVAEGDYRARGAVSIGRDSARYYWALWTGRFDVLVEIAGWVGNAEGKEAQEILRQRTRPLRPATHSDLYHRVDRALGAFVGRCLPLDALPVDVNLSER